MSVVNILTKRLVDMLGSIIGLLIISPILILIAISIKITSKGPVLFKQERLGKGGKVFKILKFRTMILNAEQLGDGLKVQSDHDSRITKIGKFLRATSLDELPQLLNVLAGQMSLVGPRPPVPFHPYKGVSNYPAWAKKRFFMRPGITGLSQVIVRASVEWDERMVFDVKYVNEFSVWLDIKILLKTFLKVFLRDSIYLQSSSEAANKNERKNDRKRWDNEAN